MSQHSVHLTTWVATIPQFPNYRMGPVEDSVCDSLGINAPPFVRFRINQDSLDDWTMHYMDLMDYHPTSWYWTFGDGGSSTEQHPSHTYQLHGTYNVCLIASNAYGSDTLCRTIEVGMDPTATESASTYSVQVFPNPTSDFVNIYLGNHYPIEGDIQLYNMQGQIVQTQVLRHGNQVLDVRDLPQGSYMLALKESHKTVCSEILIVQDK